MAKHTAAFARPRSGTAPAGRPLLRDGPQPVQVPLAARAQAPALQGRSGQPSVAVVMGSLTDFEYMRQCAAILQTLAIAYEARVLSAHRTPDAMFDYAAHAAEKGLQVIIAGAGGAAHLPGMLAAKTVLPVIGVPIPATALAGTDSLLSIAQMPQGTPVATMAIGRPGAVNAGLLAAAILALHDPALRQRLLQYRRKRTAEALSARLP